MTLKLYPSVPQEKVEFKVKIGYACDEASFSIIETAPLVEEVYEINGNAKEVFDWETHDSAGPVHGPAADK